MKEVKSRKIEKKKPKPRILLIDDDGNIRRVLTEILQEKGYRVDSAETGERAIDLSNKRFYNIALIDIRLPDMSGVEPLTRLKETKPKMRKVIITGYPTLENAIEALNGGAHAYIIKPLDISRTLGHNRATTRKAKRRGENDRTTASRIYRNPRTTARAARNKEVGFANHLRV